MISCSHWGLFPDPSGWGYIFAPVFDGGWGLQIIGRLEGDA